MKKIKGKKLIFFLVLFSILFISKSFSIEKLNFLSLKNSEVNLRQGPSLKHPIKLVYKKKFLPVIVLDKSGNFKKIKDFENNSGWIHTTQLSNRKSAINIKSHSVLYKKPTIFSKPIAKLEVGRLVLIKKCKVKWCKINSENFKGWIKKKYLWGKVE